MVKIKLKIKFQIKIKSKLLSLTCAYKENIIVEVISGLHPPVDRYLCKAVSTQSANDPHPLSK